MNYETKYKSYNKFVCLRITNRKKIRQKNSIGRRPKVINQNTSMANLMIIMVLKHLDRILEQIQDNDWHSINDLKKMIPVSADSFSASLRFLQEQAFIDIKNEKLKITGLGLRFLDI